MGARTGSPGGIQRLSEQPGIDRKDKALTELGDYRLSLTSVLGKIMEQIMMETLLGHMENKEVICDSQRGFSGGKWCCQPGAGAEESFGPVESCCPSDQLPEGLHKAFSTTERSVCSFFFFPQAGFFFFFENFNPFIWKLMFEG